MNTPCVRTGKAELKVRTAYLFGAVPSKTLGATSAILNVMISFPAKAFACVIAHLRLPANASSAVLVTMNVAAYKLLATDRVRNKASVSLILRRKVFIGKVFISYRKNLL